MAMGAMVRYSLPLLDRAETERSAEKLGARGPQDRVEMTILRPDGSCDTILLSSAAAEIVGDVLAKLAVSDEVTLLGGEDEVSPEDAAAILGISRPLVRRRMDAGVLPFRRVGTHRRLRLADVLDLKRREAPIRTAIEALKEDTEELVAHGL